MVVLILLNLLTNSFCQDIVSIRKGEVSPMDGYVIDSPMEKRMRQIREEEKKSKQEVIKLEELRYIETTRIEIYKQQVIDLEKQNYSLKVDNTLTSVLYFGLGVVVTGAASYGVIKLMGR